MGKYYLLVALFVKVKATEDVRYFTVPEARQLLTQVSKKEALEAQVTFMQNREARYEGEIYVLREADAARKGAFEASQDAVKIMKEVTVELKEVNRMYKEIVLTQQTIIGSQSGQIVKEKQSRRRNNIFTFIGGLLTPIAGAWALGRVAQSVRF